MLKFTMRSFTKYFSNSQKPIRIAVTGATGQIGYALLFRIANGDMFGYNQPVILHLIDIPQAQNALKGVKKQIQDCVFPLVQDIVCCDTNNLQTGFRDVQAAILIGAKPTSKGMERIDVLNANANIFVNQGKFLNEYANRNVKVLVAGNPSNTCCLITATHAKDLPKENFLPLTRLDHNRAVYQLAQKTKSNIEDVKRVIIWGNHSATMFPDLTWAKVGDKLAFDLVDFEWYQKQFVPTIQKRAWKIMEARGVTSGASAANAIIDHMKTWFRGSNNDWMTFAPWSNGNPYSIPQGIFYGFPVIVQNKQWNFVKGLNFNKFQQQRMMISANQLLKQRQSIMSLLKV